MTKVNVKANSKPSRIPVKFAKPDKKAEKYDCMTKGETIAYFNIINKHTAEVEKKVASNGRRIRENRLNNKNLKDEFDDFKTVATGNIAHAKCATAELEAKMDKMFRRARRATSRLMVLLLILLSLVIYMAVR